MKKEVSQKNIDRGKRARLIRSMTGLTAVEFAKDVGVTDRTIKGWELGTANALTEKGAEKVIKAAQKNGVIVNVVWLLHGLGHQPRLTQDVFNKSIAVKPPKTDSDLSKDLQVEAFPEIIKQEINCFLKQHLNGAIMQILDDSMEPYFSIGDVVGGEKLFGNDINTAVTKFCIVETQDYKLLCRQLMPGKKKGLFNLQVTNPSEAKVLTLLNQKLISAAPIIWIRKRD